MPRPVLILISVLLLLSALLGAVLFNPGLVLRPVLQTQLSNAGYRLVELENIRIRTGSAHIGYLEAVSSSLSLSAENIRVAYSFDQLLDGRISNLEISSLTLHVNDDPEIPSAMPSNQGVSLADYYDSIVNLPVDQLSLEEASVVTSQGTLKAGLFFQTSPPELSLSAQWQGEEALALEIESAAVAENRITISSAIKQNETQLFTGEHEVELLNSGLSASGELSFDPNNLANTFFRSNEQSTRWAVFNNHVLLNYRIGLSTGTSSPRVDELLVTIDSEEDSTSGNSSNLQIQAELADSRYTAQLALPLTATMTADSDDEEFTVRFSDSYQNLSRYGTDSELHVETNLTNVEASCQTWMRCRYRGDFQAFAPAWEMSGASGTDVRAYGELVVEQLSDELEMRGENIALHFTSAQYESWQGSAEFELEQALLILGDINRGTIGLRSKQLALSAEQLTLVDPGIAASVNFSGDALAGSFDLELGNEGSLDQALLHGAFNHSLSSLQGNAEISLNEKHFSEAEPLSALIQQPLNMDVVAGSIAGSTRIAWQHEDDTVQVSGPVTLQMNAHSGHVEDTLLVGINSSARGVFRDWTEIVSTPGLTASIDTVDIGLPARNVRWQYSFDTGSRELLISELNSELFGGKIEIADFRINPGNLNQELTVVLSRLNLESIVALAGYPQLFVDGLISGYIPVTLDDGQILINDGLVGALRPGGNIRYTSGSTSTAVNQAMQLVNDALSNYQYETLDTRVYYDENGDLRMEVQLQGFNPDMNGGQPINLNVNVTDNIPSLLQSLKAGQEISERLEQRLQNR